MPKINLQEKIIHDQFALYGRNAKEWLRKCVLLLPKIERQLIWQKKGFKSIYEYAAKIAGIGRATVDDALRILAKIEDKPALLKVVEAKGINAVRPVVTIATVETSEFWAEKAGKMSKHTLEIYIQEMRKGNNYEESLSDLFPLKIDKNQVGLFEVQNDQKSNAGLHISSRTGTEIPTTTSENDNGKPPEFVYSSGLPYPQGINRNKLMTQPAMTQSGMPNLKSIIGMELEKEIIEKLQKLKGQGSWNDLMKQLLQIREEHLEEQKPGPAGAATRHIPAKIEKYVMNRDNGQCAYPGCTNPSRIFQHTQRWALEKIHDPEKLYGLCKEHDQLAHLGLIANEEKTPEYWQVRGAPDVNDPKYKIDQLVQKYRIKPGGADTNFR